MRLILLFNNVDYQVTAEISGVFWGNWLIMTVADPWLVNVDEGILGEVCLCGKRYNVREGDGGLYFC